MTSFPPNEYFASRGHCVCDPTRGESCRVCDGSADEERELAREVNEMWKRLGVPWWER